MAEQVRAILIGSSGNLVEWYDFYVYSAFSLYFAKAFFPAGDQTAQLLNTAAIFAVGFLMRPIGAWLFGRMADRHGRRVALTTSVLLMCFGSGLVAVTPVYATIGIAAPVILLLARMIQGLSLGGEYGTSATYLSEMATADRRGFYSSFQYVTLIGGQLTAMLVLIALQKVVLTPEELDAWGWRIPFAIGALLSAVAFWMRRDLLETEAFQRATRREGSLAALAAHPARGRHRRWADARRNAGLLHVHDIHAKISGQHLGFSEGHRDADFGLDAVHLHAVAACRRLHFRCCRQAAGADRLWRSRHALYGSDHVGIASRRETPGRLSH